MRLEEAELLRNIKKNRERIAKMLNYVKEMEEDGVYRFYHQSLKVYYLQMHTEHMMKLFQELLPGRELNSWLEKLVKEGTGKKFDFADNKRWLKVTRPIVEAFFHAKYFLEMVNHYADCAESELESPFPSGWAAVLYLYNLR